MKRSGRCSTACSNPWAAPYCRGIKKLKLDPAAALDFSALRAGDITGTSRALGSLVARLESRPQAAAAIVGLDDV